MATFSIGFTSSQVFVMFSVAMYIELTAAAPLVHIRNVFSCCWQTFLNWKFQSHESKYWPSVKALLCFLFSSWKQKIFSRFINLSMPTEKQPCWVCTIHVCTHGHITWMCIFTIAVCRWEILTQLLFHVELQCGQLALATHAIMFPSHVMASSQPKILAATN